MTEPTGLLAVLSWILLPMVMFAVIHCSGSSGTVMACVLFLLGVLANPAEKRVIHQASRLYLA